MQVLRGIYLKIKAYTHKKTINSQTAHLSMYTNEYIFKPYLNRQQKNLLMSQKLEGEVWGGMLAVNNSLKISALKGIYHNQNVFLWMHLLCHINAIRKWLIMSLTGWPGLDFFCFQHPSVVRSMLCSISHSWALTHLSNNYIHFRSEIVPPFSLYCMITLPPSLTHLVYCHSKASCLHLFTHILWVTIIFSPLTDLFIITLKPPAPVLFSHPWHSNMFSVITVFLLPLGWLRLHADLIAVVEFKTWQVLLFSHDNNLCLTKIKEPAKNVPLVFFQ